MPTRLSLAHVYGPIIHKPATKTSIAYQPQVERQRLCIFEQCNSFAEQILYVPHRSKDSTCTITHNGLKFQVIPRSDMVDYMAHPFQTDQQIGGKYSCPCGLWATDHANLAFSKVHTTLQSGKFWNKAWHEKNTHMGLNCCLSRMSPRKTFLGDWMLIQYSKNKNNLSTHAWGTPRHPARNLSPPSTTYIQAQFERA